MSIDAVPDNSSYQAQQHSTLSKWLPTIVVIGSYRGGLGPGAARNTKFGTFEHSFTYSVWNAQDEASDINMLAVIVS